MTDAQTLSNSLYRIESELGSGGGGIVYKAWHTRLQKYVVIKELKRGTKDNIETQRNEVEALKNVKSAYLPQVLDFFTEDGRVFTVMEYIEGVSFDKLIERGEKFTQSQVVKWYAQIASALETIHGKNIAHRDIKPANIMLQPNGDVCLIDFNAALVGGSDVRLISRSLGYASPEQYDIYEKYKHTANAPIKYTTSNTVNQSSNIVGSIQGDDAKTELLDNWDNDKTELINDTDATEIIGNQNVQAQSDFDKTELLGNYDNDKTELINDTDVTEIIGNQNVQAQSDFDKTELIKPSVTQSINWKLSDIYSLGATMYHLLSGVRPSEKASELKKLSSVGEFDEGLTYIIESSMSFALTDRIPSVSALLEAIRNIYKYDSRWKKLQVKQIVSAAVLPLLFSACLITSIMGYNKMEQEKEELFYSYVYGIENGESPDDDYLKATELFDDRIDPYYAMAQRYWNIGDLEACKEYIQSNLAKINYFQQEETAYDALGGIYYILGDCFYYQIGGGDYQNAEINYELSLKYAPENPGYRRDYAITLARVGDIEGAKHELELAQRLNLDQVSLNLLNGEIDYADNKLDSALEYFSNVISQSQDDYIRYRAFHSADEIYKIQGKLQESVDLLSDSLEKIPLNRVVEMKERLADSYYKIGDNKKAILIFEELSQTNSSYGLKQNLVILYQNENEFDKAAELLAKLSKDYPNDYRVPMRCAFLEADVQANMANEERDYNLTLQYYNEAQELYSKNVKPGESDPEMQQLEEIINQLRANKWIE